MQIPHLLDPYRSRLLLCSTNSKLLLNPSACIFPRFALLSPRVGVRVLMQHKRPVAPVQEEYFGEIVSKSRSAEHLKEIYINTSLGWLISSCLATRKGPQNQVFDTLPGNCKKYDCVPRSFAMFANRSSQIEMETFGLAKAWDSCSVSISFEILKFPTHPLMAWILELNRTNWFPHCLGTLFDNTWCLAWDG